MREELAVRKSAVYPGFCWCLCFQGAVQRTGALITTLPWLVFVDPLSELPSGTAIYILGNLRSRSFTWRLFVGPRNRVPPADRNNDTGAFVTGEQLCLLDATFCDLCCGVSICRLSFSLSSPPPQLPSYNSPLSSLLGCSPLAAD